MDRKVIINENEYNDLRKDLRDKDTKILELEKEIEVLKKKLNESKTENITVSFESYVSIGYSNRRCVVGDHRLKITNRDTGSVGFVGLEREKIREMFEKIRIEIVNDFNKILEEKRDPIYNDMELLKANYRKSLEENRELKEKIETFNKKHLIKIK